MAKLFPREASDILTDCGAPEGVGFHALPSNVVDRLLRAADARKYRKPKNVNGSRARYFHAFLVRTAARDN